MFKLAAFIRSDGVSINPFACKQLCYYIRNGVIISTQDMYEQTAGFDILKSTGVTVLKCVVIGDKNNSLEAGLNTDNVMFVDTISECIKYLSDKFNYNEWWFVGDNATANNLIWKGLIMDVHLSKSYANKYSHEWNNIEPHVLNQPEMLNKTLLDHPNMEFELVSTTRIDLSMSKTIRHYMRRNTEESNLLMTMNQIITQGFKRPNRTGVNTRCLFGKLFEYNMIEKIDPDSGKSSFRLPLLTTKKMFTRGIFGELIWFLSGGTNSKDLEKNKINIWKGNTSREYLDSIGHPDYEEGECGPIYGFQWRHAGAKYIQGKHDYTGEGIDQVAQVIESLQNDPYSRRHIINAWNVQDLSEMCLPPCHVLYQFMVHEEEGQKYLSLMMYQRSCDTFLGLPFNICSLGMFLTIMAHRVNMKPFKIVHSVADMHIYENHIEAASKQIQREPCMFPYISINCDPKDKLEDYTFDDIKIDDYYSHTPIKGTMVA